MTIGELNSGEAFELDGKCYIALALTPDPFEVFCLDVATHDIVELEEGIEIEVVYPSWSITPKNCSKDVKIKALDVLY